MSNAQIKRAVRVKAGFGHHHCVAVSRSTSMAVITKALIDELSPIKSASDCARWLVSNLHNPFKCATNVSSPHAFWILAAPTRFATQPERAGPRLGR